MVECIEFNVFVAIYVWIRCLARLVFLQKRATNEMSFHFGGYFCIDNHRLHSDNTHPNTSIQYCLTKSTFWIGIFNLSHTIWASFQSFSVEQNPVSSVASQFFIKTAWTLNPIKRETFISKITHWSGHVVFILPLFFSNRAETAESTPPEMPTTTLRNIFIAIHSMPSSLCSPYVDKLVRSKQQIARHNQIKNASPHCTECQMSDRTLWHHLSTFLIICRSTSFVTQNRKSKISIEFKWTQFTKKTKYNLSKRCQFTI